MTSQNDSFLELLATGNTLEGLKRLQSSSDDTGTRLHLNRIMYGPSLETGLDQVREAEHTHLERLNGLEGQDRADVLYNLGCFSLVQDDILAARMRFSEAVNLDPDNMMARHNLAYAHELLAELDEAKQVYEAILVGNPDMGMTRLNLAQIRLQQGEIDAALDELGILYDHAPGNLGILLYLSRILLQRNGEGDADRALSLLDGEAKAADHIPLLECRAYALLLKEHHEDAEPIFRDLHNADPENLYARMGLIKILGAKEDFPGLTEALEAFNSRSPSEKIDAILTELHRDE